MKEERLQLFYKINNHWILWSTYPWLFRFTIDSILNDQYECKIR